jgi:hypothetical protein
MLKIYAIILTICYIGLSVMYVDTSFRLFGYKQSFEETRALNESYMRTKGKHVDIAYKCFLKGVMK